MFATDKVRFVSSMSMGSIQNSTSLSCSSFFASQSLLSVPELKPGVRVWSLYPVTAILGSLMVWALMNFTC